MAKNTKRNNTSATPAPAAAPAPAENNTTATPATATDNAVNTQPAPAPAPAAAVALDTTPAPAPAENNTTATPATATDNAVNTQPAPAPAPAAAVALDTTPAPAPAAENAPQMDESAILAAAAALCAEHPTNGEIRRISATLRQQYGADNWGKIWDYVKRCRATAIESSAANIEKRVFNADNIAMLIFNQLAADAEYMALCRAAVAEYGNAAAFIAAQYSNVLENGQPARKVYYIAANGKTIFAVWRAANQSATAVIGQLKTALNGLKKSAIRGEMRETTATAEIKRAKVRENGGIAGFYGVLTAENGAAVRGDKCEYSEKCRHIDQISGARLLSDYNAEITA